MAAVDTLLVRIEADMSQLKRQLGQVERQTQKSTQRMGAAFGKLKTAIGLVAGLLVVRQIARLGSSMIGLAGDAQEMQSMSEAVFKQFVGDIREFAAETSAATGRSRFELEAMAASVQDTFVPLGFARGEAAKLSKQLTTLAIDVGSFKNTLAPDVMNAFQSAIVGNHEAVRRFGIVITEAELDAELFRMGLTKSKDMLSAQEKAQARLNLIMKGTVDAQGDAAKTAGSYTNQTVKLKAQLNDLGTELGLVLLPTLTSVIVGINSMVSGLTSAGRAIGLFTTPLKEQLQDVTTEIASQRAEIARLTKDSKGLQAVGRGTFIDSALKISTKTLEGLLKRQKELQELLPKTTSALVDQAKSTEPSAAAQKKFTEQIQKLKNSIFDLRMQLKGLSADETAAVRAAGVIGDAERTAQIAMLIAKQSKLQEALKERERASQAVKEAIASQVTEEENLLQLQKDLKAAIALGTGDIVKMKGALEETERALSKQSDVMERLKEETLDAKLELQGFSEAQREAFKEGLRSGKVRILSEGTPREVTVTDSGVSEELERIKAQTAARDALLATLEEQRRAAENVKSAVAALVTEEDRLLQLQNDLKAAIQSGTGDQEKLKEALEATSQEMFKQSEAGQAVMGAIGSVSASVSSGIADVITNSGKGLKSFKEMFRDITNQIIQQLIKTKIQAMLTSAALSFGGSAFGGGGGGGGGGFSLGGIFSGIGSFFGFGGGGGAAPTTAVSTVGFAATGSSAAAGQSFLVGERGPELFTPRSSGMISPNNMMNIAMSGGQRLNGGGGPNITQNFNVSTGVQQTVRAEVLNLMPLIKQESISAVIDARQRGGSIASGLGA